MTVKLSMGAEFVLPGGQPTSVQMYTLPSAYASRAMELARGEHAGPPLRGSCPGCGGSQAVEQAGEPVIAGDVDAGVGHLVVDHDGGAVGPGDQAPAPAGGGDQAGGAVRAPR
jgi:hypothetical protein